MKVLHLISHLDYHGTARQLVLSATELAGSLQQHVGILGVAGPLLDPLQESGVTVECLNWQRSIDPQPLFGLRRMVRRFQPDIIHICDLASLRALHLVQARGSAAVLVGGASSLRRQVGAVDRWLLRQADGVIARTEAEAATWRRCGIASERIAHIPLAVSSVTASPSPESGQTLVCLGALEPRNGFRDALWAFDFLRFAYDDLRLVIIGDGPDRRRLEGFARGLQHSSSVQFLGSRPDALSLLASAAIVWIPHHAGGTNVALEAMAAGRPIVATRTGSLPEVVSDGTTGYLIEAGDKAALAKQTRLLLDDKALRMGMGSAGRQRASEVFSVTGMVRRLTDLYENVRRPARSMAV